MNLLRKLDKEKLIDAALIIAIIVMKTMYTIYRV